MGILSDLGNVWTGAKKVIGGDWKGGFKDVYSGVSSLFSNKEAFGQIQGYPYQKPNVSLMDYQVGTTAPGSSAKVGALGDTSMIPDWSRNQAVAMYYLDMINKITKQGSPRKGA
jgi:hypothetical protein